MKNIFKILFIFFLFTNCNSVKIDESQTRFLFDGKEKYFLIDFINKNNEQVGKVPTLIINKKDGQKIVRSDEEFKGKLNLKRSDFNRIEIMSIDKSIPLFGSAGKHGVLTISYFGKPNL